MTEKLKNSIKNLYKVFAKYGANDMTGSPLYEDLPKWNKEILSKPLRELDEDDLSRFTGKALTTWGSANDYKHFLPRILELTAELRTPYEIWIVFDKLNLAEWHNWTEIEQKEVHEYMIALWESIINDNSEKAEREFKDYFSTLAHFYPDFTQMLNVWNESESKASIKHLSEFLVNEQTTIFDRRKIVGFNDKIENTEEFISWVLSDEMLLKVQKKYFEYETESFAEKISWAEKILTSEKKKKAHDKRKI